MREITSLAHNPTPLSLQTLPEPKIGRGEVLIRVTACGVCHTELDEIEGRLPPPHRSFWVIKWWVWSKKWMTMIKRVQPAQVQISSGWVSVSVWRGSIRHAANVYIV